MCSIVQYLCLIFFLISSSITDVHSINRVFNVKDFGAISDGKTNNYKPILSAWNKACQNAGGGVVLIPKGTYLVTNIDFFGQCKGQIMFMLQGVLVAPNYNPYRSNSDHWIAFRYVDNLQISGGGVFDGRGATAWPYRNYHTLPISIRFDFVTKATMSYIKIINSMNFHINIFSCHDMKIDHVQISAPEDSPNTDGIHIGDSTGISITNTIVSTGDDCISLGSGLKNIDIRGVYCGPGHGISIGSLGKYPDENDVTGVIIKNCTLSGTRNGLRIKTWALSSKPITVYNVTFEQIVMNYVNNPIIIDQEYCPYNTCSGQGDSRVQIRDITFHDIRGTSSSKLAVNFKCSKVKPCYNIVMRDISLTYNGKDGHETSSCTFANGVAYGYQQPQSCL